MIADRPMASSIGNRLRTDGRRDRANLLRLLRLVDATTIIAAVIVSDLLRIYLESYFHIQRLTPERHVIASILVPPILLVLFSLDGLYDLDMILAGTREYARVVQSVSYGVLIALAVSYFAGGNPLVSRLWLLLIFGLTCAAVCGERFVVRRLVRRQRRRGRLRSRLIIVGASSHGVAIAEQLTASFNEGIDVVGFLDEYVPIGQRLLGDIEVIGRPGDLLLDDASGGADEYVLVPQALPSERLEQISAAAALPGGPTVRIAVSTTDLLTNGVLLAERANVPMLRVRAARIVGVDAVFKRALDLAGSVFGLALTAPVVGGVIFWGCVRGIRPLLIRHDVRGARGEVVPMWLINPCINQWMLVRDAPALLAVLTGGMSLVGPRPVRTARVGARNPPTGLALARPGLTGPWRLSAVSSVEQQEKRDLIYIRNYSIWDDFRLLLGMTRNVLQNGGRPSLVRWTAGINLDDRTTAAPSRWSRALESDGVADNRGRRS